MDISKACPHLIGFCDVHPCPWLANGDCRVAETFGRDSYRPETTYRPKVEPWTIAAAIKRGE